MPMIIIVGLLAFGNFKYKDIFSAMKIFRINDYNSVCRVLYLQMNPQHLLYDYFEKDGIEFKNR
jgi:hypothetical protein